MNTATSSDGTTIAYRRVGAGPAIIYVSPAFSYRAFDPRMGQIAELLAPHFTAYTYDRRGRGESGDTAPYAITRPALYEPPFIVDDSCTPLVADSVAHLNDLVAAGQHGDAVEYFMMEGPGVPAEVVAQMRGDPSWAIFEARYQPLARRIHCSCGTPTPRHTTANSCTMPVRADPQWR